MYTTESKVLQYLGLSALPSPLSSLTDFISAAQTFIENYCNRTFEETTSQDRLYDGDGSNCILIDDATEITAIKIYDDSNNLIFTLNSSDYAEYPENKSYTNRIVLKSGSQTANFLKGHQNIKITGKFGASASAPSDISFATTQLVAAMVEDNYLSATGDVKQESLGEYSVTYQSVKSSADRLGIYDILDNYRSIAV